MAMATFPQTIYTTQRSFNDYGADDMRYGDMCEKRLKHEFGLIHLSSQVDPYTLTRLTTFHNPQSRFHGVYGGKRGAAVSVQECARILFEEMQVTSLPYACVGPYKHLINKMLRHFQQSTGAPFRDMQLDMAYRERILRDNSDSSSRLAIITGLNTCIDYTNKVLTKQSVDGLGFYIRDSILPKFDSLILDKINGMGITVHDVHSTRIELLNLEIDGNHWRAKVKYLGQDHFGLDVNDIRKKKFNQFQFFRIWFILQRFDRFGFRPFLTNMEAVIDIEGGR
ncbi:YPO3983 family protein [Pantoea cypripedii]|uniref:DUF3289 domain-containing protein n=1 Tax=Pantoea cypripedii TaxID=55209 RepID=A0A1X1EPF0_PANCY|nr:DUF3289 family protein [Pantoea cypripedii]MBP2195904.1 uncharacterized protein (TIGR03034 family) [Pantoea cypripedii]ORM91878.1 hypothetical protein HA50_00320 [Pantoea cypripedii]